MKKRNQILLFLLVSLVPVAGFSQAPPPQVISLDECLGLAMQNSVRLQISALEQQRLRYQYHETIGQGLPNINFNGSFDDYLTLPTQLIPGEFFGKPGEMIPVQFGTSFNLAGSLDASQIIYNQTFMVALKISKQLLEQNTLVSERIGTDLVAEVAKGFYLAQITRKQIQNLRFNLDNLDSLLHITKSQHTFGLVTGVDVDRINVTRLNLQSSIDNLETLYKQQLSMQKYFMGIPEEREIAFPDTLDMGMVTVDTTGNLNDHIDIRMIEKQKEIVETNLKLDRSFYYPSLTFIGSVNYINQSNTYYLFGNPTDWFNTSLIGLRLNVPVFNGLQKRSKVSQTKVELQKVLLTETDTRRILSIQAKDAARKLENSIMTELRQRENEKLAERVYAVSQDRYQKGMIPLTDMLNAETALSDAQLGHINALVQMKLAEIDYLQAKGTLLAVANELKIKN